MSSSCRNIATRGIPDGLAGTQVLRIVVSMNHGPFPSPENDRTSALALLGERVASVASRVRGSASYFGSKETVRAGKSSL